MAAERAAFALFVGLVCALLACAPPDTPRHVVLVSLDAVGAAHVGAYGYGRETTPQLDALARAGTVFEAAYTQQAWTLTSHLTMLTGLDPAVHGASRNREASPAAEGLAVALSRAGFATAGFVGERVWMHPRFGHARGFDQYKIGGRDAAENSPAIVAWLGRQAEAIEKDATHRFFLFAHFYDAHSDGKGPTPYFVPGPAGRRFLPEGAAWGRRGGTSLLLTLRRSGAVTTRDREFLTAFYDAGVRWVDDYGLRAIVKALRDLGLEQDTLLVVTSDHGEEIFEHGYVLHGQPYVETAHVPLVLRGPGIAAGQRIPHLVGVVDVAPTILSQLGVAPLAGAQGRDVSSLLAGGGSVRDAVYTDGVYEGGRTWGSSVIADIGGERWSYVAHIGTRGPHGHRVFSVEGDGELYSLDRDPRQNRDIAKEHAAVAAALRRRLLAWYRANELRAREMRVAREQPLVSEEETRRLEALGYFSAPSARASGAETSR